MTNPAKPRPVVDRPEDAGTLNRAELVVRQSRQLGDVLTALRAAGYEPLQGETVAEAAERMSRDVRGEKRAPQTIKLSRPATRLDWSGLSERQAQALAPLHAYVAELLARADEMQATVAAAYRSALAQALNLAPDAGDVEALKGYLGMNAHADVSSLLERAGVRHPRRGLAQVVEPGEVESLRDALAVADETAGEECARADTLAAQLEEAHATVAKLREQVCDLTGALLTAQRHPPSQGCAVV